MLVSMLARAAGKMILKKLLVAGEEVGIEAVMLLDLKLKVERLMVLKG